MAPSVEGRARGRSHPCRETRIAFVDDAVGVGLRLPRTNGRSPDRSVHPATPSSGPNRPVVRTRVGHLTPGRPPRTQPRTFVAATCPRARGYSSKPRTQQRRPGGLRSRSGVGICFTVLCGTEAVVTRTQMNTVPVPIAGPPSGRRSPAAEERIARGRMGRTHRSSCARTCLVA